LGATINDGDSPVSEAAAAAAAAASPTAMGTGLLDAKSTTDSAFSDAGDGCDTCAVFNEGRFRFDNESPRLGAVEATDGSTGVEAEGLLGVGFTGGCGFVSTAGAGASSSSFLVPRGVVSLGVPVSPFSTDVSGSEMRRCRHPSHRGHASECKATEPVSERQ
jgi:hypothetical protein